MSLFGLHIVLMRPRDQAKIWEQNMIAKKAEVTVLPMIDIVPMSIEPSTLNCLLTADQVIITSQNAVNCAPLALIDIIIEQRVPVLTIGSSTANSLIARGVHQVCVQQGNQSEELLAAPIFQTDCVIGKKIVLIVGKGGRELIAQTLAKRGAKIHCLEVYAQEPIQYTLDPWFEKWQGSQKQVCFLITSGNILFNFKSQIPNKYKMWLREQIVVVISQRLQELAKEYGFQHIFNTNGAHWSYVLTTLQEIVKVCHTRKNLST